MPVIVNGEMVMEIDLDSPIPSRFDDDFENEYLNLYMVWLSFTDSYGAVIQTDLQPLKIFMVWFHLKLHHFYMTVCYDLV